MIRPITLLSVTAGVGFLALLLAVAPARAGPDSVSLPGDAAYPESVTATADGTLYAGSFASGGIFRVAPGASAAEVWIKPGAFGTRSILGVLADEKSGTLWACSNDLSALGVPGPSAVKGSWLIGFDLKTGAGKISARFPGKKNFCNDIATDRDGAVFVTNSLQPEILKLDPTAQKLDVWISDPQFDPGKGTGLDGIAFGADGTLYVDTYSEAKLFRVDIANGKPAVSRVEPSQSLGLTDGLRPLGGDAFLLVEGVGKLDRVTFDGNEATIETLKDDLNGPTGVTRLGDTAWVSEGQLKHLFDKDDPKPVLPFRLTAVPIPAP
ncbi:MAG: SMP-30/gluconolactonase/LRE family protein [Methylovirgula sp.]